MKTAGVRRESVGYRRGANEQAKGESKIHAHRSLKRKGERKRGRKRERKIKACPLHDRYSCKVNFIGARKIEII